MPNPLCPLCLSELTSFELEHSQAYHRACQVCKYCKSETTRESVETLIANWHTETPIMLSHSLYHSPCHEKQLMAEFRDDKLPLVQEHLDVLNKFLLSANEEIPLTLECLYPLLRNLQQAAANVSIAIARKRDKIRISEAEVYRAKTKEQKEQEKLETRKVEAAKIQRVNEKADPALRAKRKAIEGLMVAFKLTETQALALIEAQQQGKAN